MVGKIRPGGKGSLRTETAGRKAQDSQHNGALPTNTTTKPAGTQPLEVLLLKRLSVINKNIGSIPIDKKRDVFVKLSLEQHFGPGFVLSQQYEVVHQRVLESLMNAEGAKMLDGLLKKIS